MAISTNSVIHYTDSLENIKGILHEGFRTKYCMEQLVTKEGTFPGAYVMVSFCDIPLSEITSHVESYGYYGIGLSKAWAKKKGLNPVVYIDTDSSIGANLLEQAKMLIKEQENLDTIWKQYFVNLICYAKNYDGSLIRGAQSIDNYKFYNEREWRFVPSRDSLNGAPLALTHKTYLEDKSAHNDKLKNILLGFGPEDISYIIVKREDEVIDIIKHLRNIFSDKCTASQLEILYTRIITIEHIINDF